MLGNLERNNVFALDAPEWKMPTNKCFFLSCGKKKPIVSLLFGNFLVSFRYWC